MSRKKPRAPFGSVKVGDMKLGPTDHHPLGIPVSMALEGHVDPILYDSFKPVLDLIDKVHGDGNLPPLPVLLVTVEQCGDGLAKYEYNSTSGKPIGIGLTRRCIQEPIHALHEIGHFLDGAAVDRGLGEPLFQSERKEGGAYRRWWAAIQGVRMIN